jgi:hypothetical protein
MTGCRFPFGQTGTPVVPTVLGATGASRLIVGGALVIAGSPER